MVLFSKSCMLFYCAVEYNETKYFGISASILTYYASPERNADDEQCKMKRSWPTLRSYPRILLEWLSKLMEISLQLLRASGPRIELQRNSNNSSLSRLLYVETGTGTYWDWGVLEELAVQQPADPSRRHGARGFAMQLLRLPRREWCGRRRDLDCAGLHCNTRMLHDNEHGTVQEWNKRTATRYLRHSTEGNRSKREQQWVVYVIL